MKRFFSILLLSSLFIPQALAATNFQEGYYTAKVTANIRAQAGMQGKQIGYIAASDELYVRGQKGQWCDVEYRTYEHAYVLCSLLEEQTYATHSDDYYDQDSYNDDYSTLPLPTASPWSATDQQTTACDITTTTCSGDFKVSVTADLTSSNSFESFRTLKLNMHGQGRMNVKDAQQPELSLTVNGSFQSDRGSAQGSAEMVLKDKGYVRLNDLQSMNIPGMSADVIKEIQTTMLNKWFALPASDTGFLSMTPFLMNSHSNDDVQGLVAMSKFMGTDVNGANTRYHYQLDLDEKKMNWMMDGGSDEQHLTGNQSTASINYWLDSTQRLVSGSATLKIVPTASDRAAGTITISFDSSNLNQDIHVTVPENAEPLPKSLPHESDLMLL